MWLNPDSLTHSPSVGLAAALSKRRQRSITSRKEPRTLPQACDQPCKKVVDVEADIKGFFDHMDHDWLIRMFEERIADSHFICLIRKWLRAGILEEDARHPKFENRRNHAAIDPMSNLKASLQPLRDSTEEPCAGRSIAEMGSWRLVRRTERSESMPLVPLERDKGIVR